MIPITEIHPMLVHFPIVLWIGTEAIAVVVLLHGGDLSVRQQWPAVALYSLLAGITGLLVTAYLGGELVYHVRSMWRRWFADRFGGAPHHRHSGIGGAQLRAGIRPAKSASHAVMISQDRVSLVTQSL